MRAVSDLIFPDQTDSIFCLFSFSGGFARRPIVFPIPTMISATRVNVSVAARPMVARQAASRTSVQVQALPSRRELLAALAVVPLIAKPAQAGLFDGGAAEEEVRPRSESETEGLTWPPC